MELPGIDGDVDPVAELRIEIKADVIRLSRCSQVPEQEQNLRWVVGIGYDIGNEFVESQAPIVLIVGH